MWKPVDIGAFRVTPYLVDHSAPDAVAYVVETDGRKLFYTGDFRGHGRKKIVLERMLKDPVRDVDCLLIEGVGGVMVPLSDEHMVRDWIAALAAPAVVVVGSYLGTISHTLSAVETLRGRNLPVAGVVVSESVESPVPLAETGETLRRFLPGVPVETLPRLDHGPHAWRAAPDLSGLVVPR